MWNSICAHVGNFDTLHGAYSTDVKLLAGKVAALPSFFFDDDPVQKKLERNKSWMDVVVDSQQLLVAIMETKTNVSYSLDLFSCLAIQCTVEETLNSHLLIGLRRIISGYTELTLTSAAVFSQLCVKGCKLAHPPHDFSLLQAGNVATALHSLTQLQSKFEQLQKALEVAQRPLFISPINVPRHQCAVM